MSKREYFTDMLGELPPTSQNVTLLYVNRMNEVIEDISSTLTLLTPDGLLKAWEAVRSIHIEESRPHNADHS